MKKTEFSSVSQKSKELQMPKREEMFSEHQKARDALTSHPCGWEDLTAHGLQVEASQIQHEGNWNNLVLD